MILPQDIVIVEDEVITQRYLQNIFEQFDINVTGCFDNAMETIDALKIIKCDLLLLDINIKGPIDGIQLARHILKDKHLPIIFITAHNDDETLEELLELAPYGFVGKPFSSKELMVTLQIAYKRYLTHTEVHDIKNKNNMEDVILNKNYRYSKKQCTLYKDDITIKLNQKHNLLLEILVENLNHAVAYNILIDHIWGEDQVADSALRTLVYTIRKILPDLPIVSYSKIGYMLAADKG